LGNGKSLGEKKTQKKVLEKKYPEKVSRKKVAGENKFRGEKKLIKMIKHAISNI